MRFTHLFKFIFFLLLISMEVGELKSQVNLDSGLVGFFKMDGNVADSSSQLIHGTVSSTVNTQGIHPISHTGLTFSGISNAINVGTSNRTVSDTITLTAWVKTTNTSSIGQAIISKYNWNVNKGYILRLKSGYPDIQGRNNGGAYYSTTNTSGFVSDGKWHHVIGVVAGNTWEIWVDGVLKSTKIATASNPSISNNYQTYIGAYYDGSSLNLPFTGSLDEVRIYNRELLSAEITYLKNQKQNSLTQSISSCSPVSSPWGNGTLDSTGIYYQINFGSDFADSISIVDLTINRPDTQVVVSNHKLNAVVDTSYTYQWYDCSLGRIILGETNSSFIPLVSGSYRVILNNNGCVDTSGCQSVIVAPINLSSGLVGYFKLDSNTADSSTQALHGTGTSLTNTSGIKCVPNTAYDFNGTSSKIICGTNNRGVTDKVSISVWVKTTHLSGNNMFLVEKYNWSVDKGYHLAIKNGVPFVGARNTSGSGGHTWNANQTFSVADGNWHHLLGVVSQNNIEIWVDGVLMATGTQSAVTPDLTTNYNLNIGYYYKGQIAGNQTYYTGSIDEVKIYNRDLSLAEIKKISSARFTYSYETVTACDSYLSPSGSKTWSQSGQYFDTVSNLCSGDTIHSINLTILQPYFDTTFVTSCGSHLWPITGLVYNQGGTYSQTFNDQNGCDSVHVLQLNVLNSTYDSVSISTCDSLVSPSGNYVWRSSGVYNDTITNSLGCDSIITFNVNKVSSTTFSSTEVSCGAFLWNSNNQTYWNSGIYRDTLTGSNGCDSINVLDLTVNLGDTGTFFQSSCDSFYWPISNLTYYNSGLYSVLFSNAKGCDSLIWLDLTINGASVQNIQISVCDSLVSPSGSYVWKSNGIYSDTLTTSSGCDSILLIDLTVNSSYSDTVYISACDSFYWGYNSSTYFSSGSYVHTSQNSNGCDSTVYLELSINSSISVINSVSSCDTYYWGISGLTYSQSTLDTVVFTGSKGCDSILILDLTINYLDTTYLFSQACDSFYWSVNNTSYTTSGVYSEMFSNVYGCDSLVVLDLQIFATSDTLVEESYCDSFYWSLSGLTYHQTGNYFVTLQNLNGCDSLVQLQLSIASATDSIINEISCGNYTAPDGVVYSSSGQYNATIVNSQGCDSNVTINLTVTHTDTTVVQIGPNLHAVSNQNYSYQWLDCDQGGIPIPGAMGPIFTPVKNGNYQVEIENGNCLETSNCVNVINVGISNLQEKVVSIYPNPVESDLHVIYSGAGQKNIEITDVTGKVVLQSSLIPGENIIDCNLWSSGVYYVRVFSKSTSFVEKIVIR